VQGPEDSGRARSEDPCCSGSILQVQAIAVRILIVILLPDNVIGLAFPGIEPGTFSF